MSENNNLNNSKMGFTKDDAYKNLERVNFWIGNADSKISFVLAFIIALLGLLFTSSKTTDYIQKCVETVSTISIKMILPIASLLVLFFMLFYIFSGIKYLLKGLTASINIEEYKESGIIFKSNIFWGAILTKKFNEFNKELENQTEDMLLKDINSQTYINSIICNDKFKNYNKGIHNIEIAVICFIIFQVLSYIKV